jgi:hypothetical protein
VTPDWADKTFTTPFKFGSSGNVDVLKLRCLGGITTKKHVTVRASVTQYARSFRFDGFARKSDVLALRPLELVLPQTGHLVG